MKLPLTAPIQPLVVGNQEQNVFVGRGRGGGPRHEPHGQRRNQQRTNQKKLLGL